MPIIEDARHPHKYRMLVPMVDTIFADVAQPDQARIVALNAQYFLKNSGHFVISIKVNHSEAEQLDCRYTGIFLSFIFSSSCFLLQSLPFLRGGVPVRRRKMTNGHLCF